MYHENGLNEWWWMYHDDCMNDMSDDDYMSDDDWMSDDDCMSDDDWMIDDDCMSDDDCINMIMIVSWWWFNVLPWRVDYCI